MLGQGVKGYIRQMVAAFLVGRCDIAERVVTKEGTGIASHVWLDVAVNVPCRVIEPRTKSANEAARFANQESINEPYRLVVAWDCEINIDARVTVDGAVYYVTAIDSSLTDRAYRSYSITRKRGSDGV